MTAPNVIGGDKYGLKFINGSDVRIVHLCRPNESTGGGGNWSNVNPLSLYIMNSGLGGTQYVVPSGKVFYMLHFWVKHDSTTDLYLAIHRNSTADTYSSSGDSLWEMIVEGSGLFSSESGNLHSVSPGGLQFDAGDYVTPFGITYSSNAGRWAFQCWGVECDA